MIGTSSRETQCCFLLIEEFNLAEIAIAMRSVDKEQAQKGCAIDTIAVWYLLSRRSYLCPFSFIKSH